MSTTRGIKPFDLHVHSSASDGVLAPGAVVERAKALGIQALALTDHDTVAGIGEAQATANRVLMRLIPGIEISATWDKRTLHVVGLFIDPAQSTLLALLERLQAVRLERADTIAGRFEKLGMADVGPCARASAGMQPPTRTHFARALVQLGRVNSYAAAFAQYLSRGKPAYVSGNWVTLEETVETIKAAGGVSVIAHPLRYELTAATMRRLLAEFSAMGGDGVEVIAGRANDQEVRRMAEFALKFRLKGSVGSDFHDPDLPWHSLGVVQNLPKEITPIWDGYLAGG